MAKDNLESSTPAVLPITGKSRWRTIKQFCPVSRETFRKLSLSGKAPQPERMGIRCTYYDNTELHRWLANPLTYTTGGKSHD